MKKIIKYFVSSFLVLIFSQTVVIAQHLEDFKFNDNNTQSKSIVKNENIFNGYTNYWHNSYTDLYRYGNLFKMAVPNIEKTILQSKIDIAEDLGIPGLLMQEGFINNLISNPYSTLSFPTIEELEKKLEHKENILAYVDSNSELGKKINIILSQMNNWTPKLGSHQYNALEFFRVNAFYLEFGSKKLFIVSSKDQNSLHKVKDQIHGTLDIINTFDFHKGWFGAYTLLNSVTITKGHPLDVIGVGMNEGNSWFVFDGYMDFLSKDQIETWVDKVKLPVITDVGATRIFGCKDYDGFQIQQMYDEESWVTFAQKKDGYVFRKVWDTLADPYHYDGYFANEGNKVQIDNENVPFVLRTGQLDKNALSSMVLFIEKGKQLTRESMWKAILDRREVGVLERGKMIGPARFRNTLEMLVLDRVFLENYFGDRINIETKIKGYDLQVTITNTSKGPVSGTLELTLPVEVKTKEKTSVVLDLDSGNSKTQYFTLLPESNAMDKTNPIAVHYKYNGKKKSTLTMLDLPPAISVHRLLYGHTPKVNYPVTIHNFTNKSSFPVQIQVVNTNENKIIFKTSQTCRAATGTFKNLFFDLELPPGNYKVNVSALGIDYTSQLGVGKAKGAPYVYETDLNNDGIMEYRMENDSIQVTLLSTGARVIEYIVKSRKDNILFKLWPKKAIDDKRSYRKRGYYPYGGFEDFLGQGSMETHQVYHAEIIKKEGDFVRVKMWTDYFGNRLEKIFTLYGDSPLLEVRFALTFINPEANVLGPQPILELGKKHWTEDIFMVPTTNGIAELRMKPERYYGQAFLNLKEGWNAGYDTKEDITFVGAFPVDQPLFLHMWMNHPSNGDAHHYYTEFQPWLPIFQKSTMYFSYYIWGSGGSWENGVKSLRTKNLITKRKK